MSKVTNLIKELELTQAARFVLPMLYTKDRGDDFFITKNFENCFIGDANHTELGDGIYLLYNYQLTLDYIKFERKLELVPEYSTDYDYADERQVMYNFTIPEEHKADFALFKAGDYTKLSENLKKKILAFWRVENEVIGNTLYNILYGIGVVEDDMQDAINDGEVWPKPLLLEEIYMFSE
jgi:hypothetical protein